MSIPSEGPGEPKSRNRCGSAFETLEVDGYVYVRLGSDAAASPPFRIPCLENPAYAHIRLVNRFENGVTNCVENFIDVPHTASVHPRIFRDARQERLAVRAERRAGSVRIEYRGERANFGIFSRFLNRKGAEIRHVDSFHMPNVTSVEYLFGPRRHFFITSQSVPTSADETLVFTDLTYDYGIWSWLARPIIRRQAQTVIDQDVAILARQMASIRRYGSKFQSSTADVVHLLVESIRDALARGEDPRLLPEKCVDLEMWV